MWYLRVVDGHKLRQQILGHAQVDLAQHPLHLRQVGGVHRQAVKAISGTHELEEALHLIHRAWGEVRDEGADVPMPPIGVMIEIFDRCRL